MIDVQVQSQVGTDLLLNYLEDHRDDHDLLARFFNTLSYLEHLGSRKILACRIAFNDQELQHAAEETRHALRFKRLALHYSDSVRSYESHTVLSRTEAFGYFQRLDAAVRSLLRSKRVFSARTAYILVTYLIERRAEKLYPSLLSMFNEGKAAITLRSIIREEDRHLAEMESGMREAGVINDADLERLTAVEEALFSRFISVLVA